MPFILGSALWKPSNRTMAKTIFGFIWSLLVCTFEQGKKGLIMAHKVMMIANNSSHEDITSSYTGGTWSREKILKFQTPGPAALQGHWGSWLHWAWLGMYNSWLNYTYTQWHSQAWYGNGTAHFCDSEAHLNSLFRIIPGPFVLPGCIRNSLRRTLIGAGQIHVNKGYKTLWPQTTPQ